MLGKSETKCRLLLLLSSLKQYVKDFQRFHVGAMRILSCDGLTVLNPLSPTCDQHQISPCNFSTLENGAVMRIEDMITQIL